MDKAIEELKVAIEMAEKARHNKMIFQLEKVRNYLQGFQLGQQMFAEQLSECRGFVDGEN